MNITFLGTGSALPSAGRVQSGLLIEDTNSLLLDCGSGVLHRLAETETGYDGIEAVLLSHHHLDHISDLLPLLKARWLAGAETLTIAGPPGTTALVTALLNVHQYMQNRLELTLRDIETESFSIAGFDVSAIPTRHSMDCLAYRFQSAQGDFTFSGDSEAFTDLIDFADGSSVLAHDCSFPDEIDVSNHPTPSKLGTVLHGADIDQVYLTHLYPHTIGHHSEMLSSIGEYYEGDVRIAQDGLRISIK